MNPGTALRSEVSVETVEGDRFAIMLRIRSASVCDVNGTEHWSALARRSRSSCVALRLSTVLPLAST